jgi:hypothetical protein
MIQKKKNPREKVGHVKICWKVLTNLGTSNGKMWYIVEKMS